MAKPIETLLADYRADIDALDRTLNDHDARLLEKFVNEVSESIDEYITFLPETEASLWSGYSKDWLRQQFPRWERQGHAKLRESGKRDRLYRRCILPRRANVGAARADAVRAARKAESA
jgi:hypothetical protein